MALKNNKSKYRLYFTAMVFAFLWVIIGDLVAMHIRVIAGIDLYGCHQPFAKTHKEQKNFKVKSHKTIDGSKVFDSFVKTESQQGIILQYIIIRNCNCRSAIVLQTRIPDNTLRGSPFI
jgi:hypothetical protein